MASEILYESSTHGFTRYIFNHQHEEGIFDNFGSHIVTSVSNYHIWMDYGTLTGGQHQMTVAFATPDDAIDGAIYSIHRAYSGSSRLGMFYADGYLYAEVATNPLSASSYEYVKYYIGEGGEHVATYNFDGTDLELWVDGEKVASKAVASSIANNLPDSYGMAAFYKHNFIPNSTDQIYVATGIAYNSGNPPLARGSLHVGHLTFGEALNDAQIDAVHDNLVNLNEGSIDNPAIIKDVSGKQKLFEVVVDDDDPDSSYTFTLDRAGFTVEQNAVNSKYYVYYDPATAGAEGIPVFISSPLTLTAVDVKSGSGTNTTEKQFYIRSAVDTVAIDEHQANPDLDALGLTAAEYYARDILTFDPSVLNLDVLSLQIQNPDGSVNNSYSIEQIGTTSEYIVKYIGITEEFDAEAGNVSLKLVGNDIDSGSQTSHEFEIIASDANDYMSLAVADEASANYADAIDNATYISNNTYISVGYDAVASEILYESSTHDFTKYIFNHQHEEGIFDNFGSHTVAVVGGYPLYMEYGTLTGGQHQTTAAFAIPDDAIDGAIYSISRVEIAGGRLGMFYADGYLYAEVTTSPSSASSYEYVKYYIGEGGEHVATYNFDGTDLELWVDGEKVASKAVASSITNNLPDSYGFVAFQRNNFAPNSTDQMYVATGIAYDSGNPPLERGSLHAGHLTFGAALNDAQIEAVHDNLVNLNEGSIDNPAIIKDVSGKQKLFEVVVDDDDPDSSYTFTLDRAGFTIEQNAVNSKYYVYYDPATAGADSNPVFSSPLTLTAVDVKSGSGTNTTEKQFYIRSDVGTVTIDEHQANPDLDALGLTAAEYYARDILTFDPSVLNLDVLSLQIQNPDGSVNNSYSIEQIGTTSEYIVKYTGITEEFDAEAGNVSLKLVGNDIDSGSQTSYEFEIIVNDVNDYVSVAATEVSVNYADAIDNATYASNNTYLSAGLTALR